MSASESRIGASEGIVHSIEPAAPLCGMPCVRRRTRRQGESDEPLLALALVGPLGLVAAVADRDVGEGGSTSSGVRIVCPVCGKRSEQPSRVSFAIAATSRSTPARSRLPRDRLLDQSRTHPRNPHRPRRERRRCSSRAPIRRVLCRDPHAGSLRGNRSQSLTGRALRAGRRARFRAEGPGVGSGN